MLEFGAGSWGISFDCGATGETGKNPYPFGKSTYWAWQNRPDLPGNLGEAKDWDNNALAAGFPVSEYPRRGDIAVFEPGVMGADNRAGRVAMVEQVLEDGNYLASQMDDSDCAGDKANCGRINKRAYTVGAGTSFIHYATERAPPGALPAGSRGGRPRSWARAIRAGRGGFTPHRGTAATGQPAIGPVARL